MEWINHPASPFIWQNVAFAAMIFLSMFYFTISILGGSIHSDADHGVSSDADSDSSDGPDNESEHEADRGPSMSGTIVDILNTQNRCPLTLALTSVLLIWGILGYFINVIALSEVSWIGMTIGVIINFFLSGTIAVMVVRSISPIIARSMPQGHISTTSYDLIGKIANPSTILEPGKPGFIDVQVPGNEVKKLAILKSYEGPPLRRQSKVCITSYDSDQDMFSVILLD